MGTLISDIGYDFLARMSSSTTMPLSPLFERIKSFHCLKKELVVVSTYNDLVLCCAGKFDKRDYYICNPYTLQWVPLPPAPPLAFESDHHVPIGLIFDQPYYNCEKDDKGGHIIQLNAEYRCKVVRLIFPRSKEVFITTCKELKVQIFSSDTGEWTETLVSLPSEIKFRMINYAINFIYNGKLFWGCMFGRFLIGLDPFKTSTRSSVSNADDTIDHCGCYFIELEMDHPSFFQCVGTFRGCMRMCEYNSVTRVLSLRDLDEYEILLGGTKTTVRLCVGDMMKVYSLEKEMTPDDDFMRNRILGFDPNDDDILYLLTSGDRDIVRCNIHTKEWSKMTENGGIIHGVYFPLVIPWWPTPIPRLPQRGHPNQSSQPRFCAGKHDKL